MADHVFRDISRKYDKAEHAYPVELDMVAAAIDGLNDGNPGGAAGANSASKSGQQDIGGVKNGGNLSTAWSVMELCCGDVGLLFSMSRQGLGNVAIAVVAMPEQKQRLAGRWAVMAITEPTCGSDSVAIRTTAKKEGDHYIFNGEKIFVTVGDRCDCVVVWATFDKSLGRVAIKSFVVEKGTPGMTVTRLEKKLGIKSSDTAAISFVDCRVLRENFFGSLEVDVQKGFAGVMETFDNTRPLVAAMAVGVACVAFDRVRELLVLHCELDYATPALNNAYAAVMLYRLEAEWEAAYLLTLKAAWMGDNRLPNSKDVFIVKAKAGCTATEITLPSCFVKKNSSYSEMFQTIV